jgi:hypothetical protein
VKPQRRRLLAGLGALGLLGPGGALWARPVPQITVTPGADGASQVVHGEVEIAAPAAVVWALMADPVAAPKLVANMRVSRTLEHDPAGRFDIREQISNGGGLVPAVRTVVRMDYAPPDRIRFHRVDGDLKALDGEWRLMALGPAQTLLIYDSRLVPPFSAPGPFVRQALRSEMTRNLANVRNVAEARAAGQR